MNHSCRRIALALFAHLSLVLQVACGGQSQNSLSDDGANSDACPAASCAANEAWNQASCACEPLDGNIPPAAADASEDRIEAATDCPCPGGSMSVSVTAGQCVCVPIEAGADAAVPPADATPDTSTTDSPEDAPHDSPGAQDAVVHDSASSGEPLSNDSGATHDSSAIYDSASSHDSSSTADSSFPLDATSPLDSSYFYGFDSSYSTYDSSSYCAPTACGPGYGATPSCECFACTNACPAGETPSAGCGGCSPCGYKCPAGLEYGSGCNCGPPGSDAGPDTGDGGGVSCLLEGYISCSAGSWCQLGICPDNTSQYGCYCNPDGTADCDSACPVPPPCTIPGEGTCPYGDQCLFGHCAADPSSSVLICSCSSGGSAYCQTAPCSELPDSGPGLGLDAGDGGTTCLLEGNYPCSAGSFCALGFCPYGGTELGCTCNADGTATCQLVCPAPPPCTIPGEGVCPYGAECTYGTCSGNTGTQLSCSCGGGGVANCYTVSCGWAEAGAD